MFTKKIILFICVLTIFSTRFVHAKEIEVGFSTNGSALKIILNAINQAKSSIYIAAYNFTSKPISLALLNAKKRGVDIKVLADKKASGNRYTAVTFLKNHKIETCLTGHYSIMHNKFIIIDDEFVETGSFNYSGAAAKKNAENIVLINNKNVAKIYKHEFDRLYNECLN